MSNFGYITTSLDCQKCKAHNEFKDDLKKNGMRPNKCNDYKIIYIRNVEDDEIHYNVTFKCLKCKKFGKLEFIFTSSQNNNTEKKTYKSDCQCGADVQIELVLLPGEKDENKNEQNINNINNNNNLNNNNNFNNQFNQFNNNGNFNRMNIFGSYNPYMMNNNPMMNGINNMNNFGNMNNMGNMYNMNNNMNNIRNSMNNMNDNIMNNNNLPIMNIQAQNIEDNPNIRKTGEILNNNFTHTLNLTFEFPNNLKIKKNVRIDKPLIDVLNEIKIENSETEKLIDNKRDNILLCGGEVIDSTQTINQINQKNENIKDGSIVVVQFVESLYDKK